MSDTENNQAMALAVGRAMNKSAELLRSAAKAGDAEAQFALALLYLLGRGVKQNSGEAFRLFGLAHDAGAEQAETFRDMAAAQLAQEQQNRQDITEGAAHVLMEAKRQNEFPKPKIVEPD